eukprot:8573291-Lingulodinium_polyedra.AAC.1
MERVGTNPLPEFFHESFCSGTCMELFAERAMQLGWSTLCAADLKPYARAFCLKNHTNIQHMLCSFQEQALDKPPKSCDVCRKKGKPVCTFSSSAMPRPHLAMGGLPCQPFSKLRKHTGS